MRAGIGLVSVLAGTWAFTHIALARGESISAAWLVIASLSVFTLAYRYYSHFLAHDVLGLDDRRLTPAYRHEDGLDHVPTPRGMLFGHHFAAIAGAGPLIGPVLAAQLGYLPGTLWILAGVVFAGAVQDMIILFFSTRRDAQSLGEMIRTEIGPAAGLMASLGILAITIILLAVLALVVVKAMSISPWSTFTLVTTLPIALFMGLYLRYWRPGRVLEVSVLGVLMLLLAIIAGGSIAAHPASASWFTLSAMTLAKGLMVYAVAASVLPVWLLLAPRDYLSSFLKIGTIIALAIGILVMLPPLRMPALSQFIHGQGPVFPGNVFPFLFITIACGAISGFHALVSSGTTPRMLQLESHIRPIGYGAMLAESAVAMMALIAASTLDPGVYFAMNAPASILGHDVQSASQVISHWGFVITPDTLLQTAHAVGENSLLSRVGGAPTLALGLAQILSGVTGQRMMAFWYHFAILFEALFILTTVDAGTRVGRFLLQDILGHAIPAWGNTRSWVGNLVATCLFVGAWGYFLITGVKDPLGGIHTLWPLFGIANQMLAGMALLLGCVILIRMQKKRYLAVVALPTLWVLLTTLTAAWQKMFSSQPAIGFLAHARQLELALSRHQLLVPAKSLVQMQQILFNDRVDFMLCALFSSLVLGMVLICLRVMVQIWSHTQPSTQETAYLTRTDLEDVHVPSST